MKKLFAYGTLMNDEVVLSLLSSRLPKITATLNDYVCFAVSGEDYPGIRPEKGAVVEGMLIDELTEEQLFMLDVYEGEYYQRITVQVQTADNQEQRCETYVFKPEYYKLLSNKTWSNDYFRQHRMKQFLSAQHPDA